MTEWIKQGNLTGPVGPVGPANELVVGEVETLPYTEPAYVEITPVTATPPYQVISFGIPQGLPGSGNIEWDDILNKPVTFPPTTPIPWSDISGTPSTFPPTLPIPWSGLSGVPTTFPPTLPIPWTSVSGKPTTFPPTVPISWTDITGQPATYPPTLPIAQSGVTNLVSDQAAQNTAIAGKAPTVHTHAQADVTNLVADLALKAPLASPALTGNPTAPTPTAGDSDTSIATTAFVAAAIIAIPPPPPGTTVSATAPSSPQTGAMWWNTANKTLRIWDGTTWQTVFATWDDSSLVTIWGDDFNRANATLDASLTATGTNGGWTWTMASTGGFATISSNQLNGTSTGDGGVYLKDTGVADHYVEFKVLNTGSVGNFVLLRCASASASADYLGVRANGSNIEVFRRVGSYSSIYNISHSIIVGSVIRAKAVGSNLELFKNGASVATVAIGATMTGTWCGLHPRQAAQTPWLDDFLCGRV